MVERKPSKIFYITERKSGPSIGEKVVFKMSDEMRDELNRLTAEGGKISEVALGGVDGDFDGRIGFMVTHDVPVINSDEEARVFLRSDIVIRSLGSYLAGEKDRPL